ncbi:MAG: hypothetical protein WD648_15125 [Planctomycetaceae bacterium]
MATVIGLVGCADVRMFEKLNPFGNGEKFREATAEVPAVEILALWQPADGRGLNGMPTRGFAGQVMFFTNGDPAPVKVNGDVRIFLFDDFGTPEEQSKPIHQFDYSTDIWNLHLQKSMLGPSYQVFVPYVRKDHHAAKCAISVRLKPVAGPTIYSKLVPIALPGLERETATHGEASVTKAGASHSHPHPHPSSRQTAGDAAVTSAAKGPATAVSKTDEPMPQQTASKIANPLTLSIVDDRKDNEHLEDLVQQLMAQTAKPNAATRTRRPELPHFDVPVDDVAPSKPFTLNPALPANAAHPTKPQMTLTSTDEAQLTSASSEGEMSKRYTLVESAENWQTVSGAAIDVETILLGESESIETEPLLVQWPEAAQAAAVTGY